MRVATKGILISVVLIGISGSVFAQGAGGGAAGGQGSTGMSKPNAGGATDTVSGASMDAMQECLSNTRFLRMAK